MGNSAMQNRKRKPCQLRRMLTLVIGVGLYFVCASATEMAPPTLSPQTVAMGTFYNGVRVQVEGTAPADSNILVVVRGAEKDEFFNRKGRVGVIWLNVDRIHIQRAPSVFLRFSSADVNSLLDRASLNQYELDESAIKNRLHCLCHCKCNLAGAHTQASGAHDSQPDPAYAELLRTNFLRLKEREGSYRMFPGAVSLSNLAGSGTKYALNFLWPRKAAPGNYDVEVYACCNGKVIARSVGTLQVAEVGFPAYMASLSSERPWLYGAIAVLVAMVAGFGTDALTTWIRNLRKRASPVAAEIPLPEKADAAPKPTPDASHQKEEKEEVPRR
jgi:hypothetical protein